MVSGPFDFYRGTWCIWDGDPCSKQISFIKKNICLIFPTLNVISNLFQIFVILNFIVKVDYKMFQVRIGLFGKINIRKKHNFAKGWFMDLEKNESCFKLIQMGIWIPHVINRKCQCQTKLRVSAFLSMNNMHLDWKQGRNKF